MNIRISVVSFSNTLPFRFGLSNYKFTPEFNVIIEEDVPSKCAKKMIEGKVDIGLIPVAMIKHVPNGSIITDYCLGTKGNVESVLLLSDKPFEKIKTVKLDNDSETSNKLIQILSQFFWKKDIRFSKNNVEHDGYLLIGDKAMNKRSNYEFSIDLGAEWKKFTGLPFVFACWVTNRILPEEFLNQFSFALNSGFENIQAITKGDINLYKYLTENIDFKLDADKQATLKLFNNYLEELQT